jgi:pyruvate formate lyase activating enzyme
MKIGGLQKFSLLDYPKELSAIIFTQAAISAVPIATILNCGARCFWPLAGTEKVLHFLYRRRRKLSAVVVTAVKTNPAGRSDSLPEILKAMRFKIKLDTNALCPMFSAK